jgi:membrane-associated phospholipid phosphatase
MASAAATQTSVARPAWDRRTGDVVAILAGLSVLVACGLIARDGEVGPLEAQAFRAVNGLPEALTPLMRGAQYLGVLVVGPIVALGALVLRRYRLALAALIVTGAKLASERVVWMFVVRSRPGTSIVDAIVRSGTPTSGQSFVSGHVVLVTGLAWVITPYLRGRWRIVPGAIAALVAFARLYLGAHAPLDVLGGAALGAVIGGAVNLAVGVPSPAAAEPTP